MLPEYVYEPAQSRLWLEVESVRSDNWNQLLNDGISALEWRLRAIDSAAESIEFQTFLWDLDSVGHVITSRLLAAADRGVRVRILVDDSFLFASDSIVSGINAHPNIEYRVFNPFKRRSSGLISRQILNLGEFHRLNFRMHNKVMIVDRRVAILGGRNIADQYFGLHETGNFRDLEVMVGGSINTEIGLVITSEALNQQVALRLFATGYFPAPVSAVLFWSEYLHQSRSADHCCRSPDGME